MVSGRQGKLWGGRRLTEVNSYEQRCVGAEYGGDGGDCAIDVSKVSIYDCEDCDWILTGVVYYSALTPDSHELFEVMDMIDRRLNDKGKNWRHVMKALTLLDYIIHYGSENVVLWSKDNLYIIKTLREFQYIDEEGRDQGANIRAKARELTSLLQDDDRLRAERTSKNGRRRRRGSSRPPPPNRPPLSGSNTGRSNRRGSPTDSDLQRALEESRLTAEEEERRRRQTMATQSDTDLQKALKLSKEEEQYRGQLNQNNILFDNSNNTSQPNLIDTSDVWQSQPQAQPQFVQQQPQQQQFFQQQQPMVTGMMPQQQQQQQQQMDLFGNPVQQPMATGMLQNAYATGGQFPQQQQVTGFPQQQQQFAQPQQQQQQPEPQPLQPLKTGSNNPFAKQNHQSTGPTQPSAQSLNRLSNGQQQQPLQQSTTGGGLQPQRTNNFDNQHMSELNTLLATGDGIDTFGNVGELRIPAQHTKSTYVNSSGQGLTTQPTNNPFMAQYTGVATTNQIQPAFTGYGFGNAQQSQQSYQQQQQKQNNNNLIDL